MTDPSRPTPEPTDVERLIALDDLEWAVERLTREQARALVDAQLHGKKLLKGFGYPDEVFCRAQDARAIATVLAALRAAQTREQEVPRCPKCDQPVPDTADLVCVDCAERACAALREQLQVVEHQRDVANQYGQVREDEIATLRAQVQQAREAIRRNAIIHDDPKFVGEWVAIPREDFQRLAALLSPTGGD